MREILKSLSLLRPMLKLAWWTPPAMILLGLLAAVSEGFSITLLIPLLGSQTGAATTGTSLWFTSLFGSVPETYRLTVVAGCFLAGILLKNVLTYGYTVLFLYVNTGIGHQLRSGILRQVLDVSQSYLDRQESGRLLNTLGTETWRMASALSLLADMLINVCMVVIFGTLLLVLSWKLALVCALFFLLISVAIRLVTWRIKRLGGQAVSANEAFAHRMLEIFNGLRVIRLFGAGTREQERFDSASLAVRRTFFHVDRLSALVHPLSEALTAIFLVGLLVITWESSGRFAVTLTFLVLLYRLHGKIKILDGQRVSLTALSTSVETVRNLLDRSNKPYLNGGIARPEVEAGICFKNVSLTYDSASDHALHSVNIVLPSAKTTALVGASGSGKSSIVNLVCRLYDPTSGSVLVGDCDLRTADLAWWRSRIAVVSQDVHLFHATVEENIAYGAPGASQAQIIEAARRANAADFIEALPKGYATDLGDRGLRLSGGQKQRIALARALIRDPRILILDEATNALDLESERLVQDALEKFSAGRTVLVVAHRLSTIERADQIIVLDTGRVVEQGTFRDLSMAGGTFSRLCALQYRKRPTEGEESSELPDC